MSHEDREALSPPREVRGRRCGGGIRRPQAGRAPRWAGCRQLPHHWPGRPEEGAGGLGGGQGPGALPATCSVRETQLAARAPGVRENLALAGAGGCAR